MKLIKRCLVSFLVILCLCVLVSVVFPFVGEIYTVQAATVALNTTKKTIYVGNSYTLKISGTSSKPKWSSSNAKIATVSESGKVTAKKKGTVTITAKIKNKKYKCKITVKNVSISKKAVNMSIGEGLNLKLNGVSASKIKWSSSNTVVATVSSSGRITAKKKGTTTIKAKAGSKTYSCSVTVIDSPKLKYTVTKSGNEKTSSGTNIYCIEGIVTNTSNKNLNSVYMEFELYDSKNKKLTDIYVADMISWMDKNGKWRFRISSYTNTKTVKKHKMVDLHGYFATSWDSDSYNSSYISTSINSNKVKNSSGYKIYTYNISVRNTAGFKLKDVYPFIALYDSKGNIIGTASGYASTHKKSFKSLNTRSSLSYNIESAIDSKLPAVKKYKVIKSKGYGEKL